MAKSANRPDLPVTPAEPAEPKANGARLSIQLVDTPEGERVEWERMRDTTKARLGAALRRDPALAAELVGTPAPSAAPAGTSVAMPAEVVRALYSMLGTIEATAAERFYRFPPEIAETFHYTPAEIARLEPPTQRILSKWSGTWITKYQDECALALDLVAIHMEKVQKIQVFLREIKTPAPMVEFPRKADEPTPEPVS